MDDQTFGRELPSHQQIPLSSLSRAFLSADDAARFAHEQVGIRRDREYVACIFRRNDQRFVVTEPIERGRGWHDPRELYPVSEKGSRVYPENHVLHGFFCSHVALSMLDPVQVHILNWTRDDAAKSLMMFNIDELRHVLADEVPVYLSGAEDSLIMFKPDSTRSATLLEQVGTPKAPGELALNYEKGVVKPGKLARETAACGDLQVLVSNGRWKPGKMTQDIIVGPWGRRVPERVAFGAIFQSADEAALDRHSVYAGNSDVEQTWFGFILKQKGKQEYIATELVPVSVSNTRDKLFSLRSLFARTSVHQYIYPESFQVHSYFYVRQSVEALSSPANKWLAENFIVPIDLFVVLYNSKKYPNIETNSSIPLYISSQDGALLKYVAHKDTRLFDNDTPNMGLEDFESKLSSGAMTSTGFVREVANSGELQVLRTSLCWDRHGAVGSFWMPSMNLQRRMLGPVFTNANDAAIYARAQLPSGSARAFGGLILQRPDSFFVATTPTVISREDFDDEWVFPKESRTYGQFPAGCSVVARYRSRVLRELPIVLSEVDKQVYRNMLSVNVVAGKPRQIDDYLFAPDGSIIRFRMGFWAQLMNDLAVALSERPEAVPGREIAKVKEKLNSGWLTPTHWVKKLASHGSLQVVVGSALWGPARAVTEFEPFAVAPATTGYTRAVAEPAYSPVFVEETGAARFAHERAGNRSALSFGFILRYARRGAFIASLPIAVEDSKLAPDRVFPATFLSSLVTQYITRGLYLCAARVMQILPDHDYRHFFSPLDVNLARESVRTPQGYRPIYFSCADGALLRLQLNSFDPQQHTDRFGQIELRDNPFATIEQALSDWGDINEGTFRLDSYIRRMARFGTLEVLLASSYWSRLGVVGQDWTPRMSATPANERWANNPELAMGPVFHHPDDAARYAHSRAGSTDEQASVHVSAILAQSSTHSYIALEPLADPGYPDDIADRIFRTASDVSTTSRNRPPRIPDGYQFMAGHQLFPAPDTHLADNSAEAYTSFPSPSLIYAHTHALKAKGFDITAYYYSTRYGALLKYTPNYSSVEKTFLQTSQLPLVDGKWITVSSTEEFISRLAEIGNLEVLLAAFYWRQAGRLGLDWKVTRQQGPDVFDKPARDEL